MDQRNVPPVFFISKANLLRISIAIVFAALVMFPSFTVSSASLSRQLFPDKLLNAAADNSRQQRAGAINFMSLPKAVSPFMTLFPQGAFLPESVATYESDCTTPRETFAVGDTVCAVAAGTLLRPGRIYWVNSQGAAVQTDTISPESPSATWVVSASGNWKVYLSDFESLRTQTSFRASDPLVPKVDLAVSNNITHRTEFVAGAMVEYEVKVLNNGPDAAADVVLTQSLPNLATLLSSSQNSGAAFGCTDTATDTTCTVSSLASGASASFTFIYQLASGTPTGTVISNTATLASTTSDSHQPNNSSVAEARIVPGAAPSSCTLDCPNDITTAANTTQGGNSGANVTFANAEGFGDCGAISPNKASGSFFPVGVTTVLVNSETGGGSCSFNVTVLESAPPSITCPSDQTATAPANSSEATVDPGTPTTNPSTGVSVTGVRSDSEALNAPYPVGTTFITWTATNTDNLSSSCTQRITVTSETCGTDTEDPTIVAPDDVSVTTPPGTVDSCGFVVGEGTLGAATATDNCTVSVSRSAVPAGNFFPVGTTTITYTATDGAGRTATDTQTITVSDGSDPFIEAPADASYVCLSEVPAANPAQASRGTVLDGNGNPLPAGPPFDNCGVPTVGVTESNNGGAGSTASPLVITRVFTATDAAGNSSSDTQTITVADGEAPTIAAPADASFQCASNVPVGGAGDATASDNCGAPDVSYSESSTGAGSPASPLVITRTYTATDAAGNTASDSQTITVIDNTAPSLTVPTATTASADNSCQAGIPNVVSGSNASDNCAGAVSVTQSPAAGTLVGLGSHPITVTATDAAGNITTATTGFTVNDTTAPVLSCPANIVVTLPANTSATSMAVSFPAPTATDNCSVPTVATSAASGSVFPVGTSTVTSTATDAAGNQSSCSFTVTVLYNFTGFFSPVNNLPTLNSVNAGRAVPVKFSLSGNKGMDIFAANSPYTVSFNCDTNDPGVDVTETLTSGNSSLSYNSSSDQYHYTWKTETSWAGTCRQLVVKLNDGSSYVANFRFK